MQITKDGISYSVPAILENHCCEIECLVDGQRGGWIVRCTPNLEASVQTLVVREFHSKMGLEDAMTKAAKHYLNR